MVWPTRLIFLAMSEVLSFGFNLAVLDPSDRKGSDTYCIVAIEDKKMGFISYCLSLSLYIMSSCQMCGVIVIDAESFRSTCRGRDAYIHDHA